MIKEKNIEEIIEILEKERSQCVKGARSKYTNEYRFGMTRAYNQALNLLKDVLKNKKDVNNIIVNAIMPKLNDKTKLNIMVIGRGKEGMSSSSLNLAKKLIPKEKEAFI